MICPDNSKKSSTTTCRRPAEERRQLQDDSDRAGTGALFETFGSKDDMDIFHVTAELAVRSGHRNILSTLLLSALLYTRDFSSFSTPRAGMGVQQQLLAVLYV